MEIHTNLYLYLDVIHTAPFLLHIKNPSKPSRFFFQLIYIYIYLLLKLRPPYNSPKQLGSLFGNLIPTGPNWAELDRPYIPGGVGGGKEGDQNQKKFFF